jgi:hypothetical protein
MPKSFKMALPSMMHGYKEDIMSVSKYDQREEWPPLLNLSEPNARRAISAPEMTPAVQNSKTKLDRCDRGRVLNVNGKHRAWFQPSKGLNILFSRVRPKPHGIKTSIKEKLNPNRSPTLQPLSHQGRTYAEALKMEGAGSGRGFGNGRREEDDRDRQHEHGNQNAGGGNVNPGDRLPFNPGRHT